MMQALIATIYWSKVTNLKFRQSNNTSMRQAMHNVSRIAEATLDQVKGYV
jgi:hypothetical protein